MPVQAWSSKLCAPVLLPSNNAASVYIHDVQFLCKHDHAEYEDLSDIAHYIFSSCKQYAPLLLPCTHATDLHTVCCELF